VKSTFAIRGGVIVPADEADAPIVLYSSPEIHERQQITEQFHIEPYDVESALDVDEVSRFEATADRVLVIWKRPLNASSDQQIRLDVASLGLFLVQDRLVIVMGGEPISFTAKEVQNVSSPLELVLRFVLHTIHHFMGHLRVVKQITAELESKTITSLENRYLLQMFTLGESLIYYVDAIEANSTVLSRLRTYVERLGLQKSQIDALDDIILENQQCARQAEIYSSVLSGLMDARGSIINNNVNVLLRNLTVINVIFLPLNLLAGIGGMSEFSMMTHAVDWRISYSLLLMFMVLVGLTTWIMIDRMISRRYTRGPKHPKR